MKQLGVVPRTLVRSDGTLGHGGVAGARRLLEGTSALERSDWEATRTAFQAALEAGETPDARDGLGLALWFLGDVEEGIAARERAFEGFVRDGRCGQAAHVAV